ncbi:putative tyrosine carboxypeptidase MATCAP2 isoform X2 [Amia ocellicauda]|uniref:putative tyrosine carboxypeptidase MATCAP2 isoform X2 n=1 Tax=Amia ocellicauda TaxID=2972642 RepID=UPI00346411B6
MLESIKVTERLHWPELELSKNYLLSPTDKPVSLSPVGLQKLSSSILKDIFTTGTSSYNVLLQAEEEKASPKKLSSTNHKKMKESLKSTSTGYSKEQRKAVTPLARTDWSGDHKQSVVSGAGCFSRGIKLSHPITVTGRMMGLSPRPRSRPKRLGLCSTQKGKLPHLSRLTMKEGDSGVRKLCILTAIKPSNVEKEKAKFFKSEFTYNPQFEYANPISPLVLARHSNASDRFLTQAVNIMELALQKYGNYERFEQVTGGSLLTKSRIWNHVKKYMEKEGCLGEIVVHLTDDLLSRASMTVVSGRPTLTINIGTAREHWLEGMLRHEIGTHYFRGINNNLQPWCNWSGRKKHNLKPINPTEEGLASIHSVLFRKDPTLWRAALLYFTVYQASRLSFSELFRSVGRFVKDPNTRWDYCVRAKRGQTNTALPGCFSKDQVYLDGILKILRHREKINFPLLTALGKDRACYMEQLNKIMDVNQLTDEELQALI